MTDWLTILMLLVTIGGFIILGGVGYVIFALLVTSVLSGDLLLTVLYAGASLFLIGLVGTLVVFILGEE